MTTIYSNIVHVRVGIKYFFLDRIKSLNINVPDIIRKYTKYNAAKKIL